MNDNERRLWHAARRRTGKDGGLEGEKIVCWHSTTLKSVVNIDRETGRHLMHATYKRTEKDEIRTTRLGPLK